MFPEEIQTRTFRFYLFSTFSFFLAFKTKDNSRLDKSPRKVDSAHHEQSPRVLLILACAAAPVASFLPAGVAVLGGSLRRDRTSRLYANILHTCIPASMQMWKNSYTHANACIRRYMQACRYGALDSVSTRTYMHQTYCHNSYSHTNKNIYIRTSTNMHPAY